MEHSMLGKRYSSEDSLPRKRNKIAGAPKVLWSSAEDATLVKLVQEKGEFCWSEIAARLPGRVGKQCRDRWRNHLNPDIKKGGWSPEEDRLLFFYQQKFGHSWSNIAKHLPGRTDLSVKNRWYSYKRKEKRQKIRLMRTTSDGSVDSAETDSQYLGDEIDRSSSYSSENPRTPISTTSSEASTESLRQQTRLPIEHSILTNSPSFTTINAKNDSKVVSNTENANAIGESAIMAIVDLQKELHRTMEEKNRLQSFFNVFMSNFPSKTSPQRDSSSISLSSTPTLPSQSYANNKCLESVEQRTMEMILNLQSAGSPSQLNSFPSSYSSMNNGSAHSMLSELLYASKRSESFKRDSWEAPADLLLGLSRPSVGSIPSKQPCFNFDSIGMSPTGTFKKSAAGVYANLRVDTAVQWNAKK